MNNRNERKSQKWNFSLRHLLVLTALAALSFAITIAYRKNETLNRSREALLSLSSRLHVTDEDELTHVKLPNVANNLQTWEVHVPRGPALELRLGIGEVSDVSVPTNVDRVALPAGRHRITLHAVVSLDNGNRFVVYVDGKQAIEKTPAPDWLPSGWRSSTGLSLPKSLTTNEQNPLQLTGQRYTPRIDIGNNSFNGSDDGLVTSHGYRLWIDQADRAYVPASPFWELLNEASYRGIGLRDGLRYKPTKTNELTLTRPKSRVSDPVLRIIPEFIVDGQTVLSTQTPSFKCWHLRNDPIDKNTLGGTKDPQPTVFTTFLHADLTKDSEFQPVIELKWDADKPNSMGLRLAKTQANEQISRWRLRIAGGNEHLWRTIELGEQTLDSRKLSGEEKTDSSSMTLSIDDVDESESDIQINWQTDQSLPLQVVQNSRVTPNPYSGMNLYQGLPLTFGARIPKSLAPSISATKISQDPTIDAEFPGGAVFDEIQIELKADQEDWIWLQAEDRKISP